MFFETRFEIRNFLGWGEGKMIRSERFSTFSSRVGFLIVSALKIRSS